VTTSSNSIHFAQYLRLPYIGEAHVSREDARRYWLPFFNREVRRTDSTYNQHGELDGGAGDLTGFTLRVGRWQVIVDRPQVEVMGSSKDPLAWNKAAWLVLGAPVVTLATIAACLLGGVFSHVFGKSSGPSRPTLLPEL
jgi:hypothetical protein